jgi:hypothetical protein
MGDIAQEAAKALAFRFAASRPLRATLAASCKKGSDTSFRHITVGFEVGDGNLIF